MPVFPCLPHRMRRSPWTTISSVSLQWEYASSPRTRLRCDLLRLLPKGTHDYAKFITPAELASFARGAGLEVADLVGMTYNPITQVYALGSDTDVNYIVHATRPE